jgi:hypothetical protein
VGAAMDVHHAALNTLASQHGPQLTSQSLPVSADRLDPATQAAVTQALCSVEALRWARSAVLSRCFSVRHADAASAEVSAESCMVPVVDMLDHDPTAQV